MFLLNLQELYFITAGTLQHTLSFNSDGDSRLSLPGQPAGGTVERVFTYGPGTIHWLSHFSCCRSNFAAARCCYTCRGTVERVVPYGPGAHLDPLKLLSCPQKNILTLPVSVCSLLPKHQQWSLPSSGSRLPACDVLSSDNSRHVAMRSACAHCRLLNPKLPKLPNSLYPKLPKPQTLSPLRRHHPGPGGLLPEAAAQRYGGRRR